MRGEAELRLPPQVLEALDKCHLVRRSRGQATQEALALLATESEAQAGAAGGGRALDAAWSEIDATGLKRAAHRLLSDKALAQAEAKDRRRGWEKVERELRDDPLLPASFRANPAQHFYALQLGLAERRRQRWREACDREPDAFELAA